MPTCGATPNSPSFHLVPHLQSRNPGGTLVEVPPICHRHILGMTSSYSLAETEPLYPPPRVRIYSLSRFHVIPNPYFFVFPGIINSRGQITSISDCALPSAAAQTEGVAREIHFGLRFRTCIFYRLCQVPHCKRLFRTLYEISRLYCCAVDSAHHRVFI